VGVVEVHAILEKLDRGQTSIVLLRRNQSSDGVDDEVDTGCGLKEVGSIVTSDVRRDIYFFMQLLQS
jgi:hypothetical protein